MFIEQPVENLEDAKGVVEDEMRQRGHTPVVDDQGRARWRHFGHPDGSVLHSLDCTMCRRWGSVTDVLTMSVPDECKLWGARAR